MNSFEQPWRQAILPSSATIGEALENLDLTAIKIVLVIDASGRFEGTVSDGDIRRALLKGYGLSSILANVVHHGALVAPLELTRETALQLMKSNKIQQIPIVDSQQKIVGLHLWEEITTPAVRDNTMLIMAGGMGTRLRPYTENCPKPLVLVAGRPILEHIIERAKLEGFNNFIFAVHYLREMIEDHFGDGKAFNIQINYLRETSPLGTAGALSLLAEGPEAPFIVTNGDVITDIRYGELLDFHIRHNALATMAIRAHEWQNPFGVVRTNGMEIVGFEEKPIVKSYINAGVYALSPGALQQLSPDIHCDMPTLFSRLQEQGKRTLAYPMHEPWLDIGRPEDLNNASSFVAIDSRKA